MIKTLSKKVKENGLRNINILLLGFKEMGRGEGFKKHQWNHEKVLKKIKELVDVDVITLFNCDTLYARQIGKETLIGIFGNNILQQFYTVEGLFSKYIDLVDWKIAPSSYEQDKGITTWFLNEKLEELLKDIKFISY